MNGEKFWNSLEFRRFVLYFTFLLVWAPMVIGIHMALAENMPSKQEIKSYVIPERQDLSPCCPHFTCRFNHLSNP